MYLEEGALEKHDTDAVVGLLTMTLMAAVFNTQAHISADYVLIHLGGSFHHLGGFFYSSRRILYESRRIV